MQNENPVILSALVDQLASVKAQLSDLKALEDQLKAAIVESGQMAIDGTSHRATVSHCTGREVIDWQSIAARYNPSRQLITAHTSTGAPYDVIRVSARKGGK
jgi:hypothetical protein